MCVTVLDYALLKPNCTLTSLTLATPNVATRYPSLLAVIVGAYNLRCVRYQCDYPFSLLSM